MQALIDGINECKTGDEKIPMLVKELKFLNGCLKSHVDGIDLLLNYVSEKEVIFLSCKIK